MTISSLKSCRKDDKFELMWDKAILLANNIKKWLSEEAPEIEFKDPILPRVREPSRCQQALVGEDTSGQSEQPSDVKTLYRIKYFSSLDAVIGELVYRFQGEDNDLVCALGRVCLDANVNHETMNTIAGYYKVDINT